MMADQEQLDELRAQIDSVDTQLISLLNERANIVVEVGKQKQGDGTPIYAPHREKAVLSKVIELSNGPLHQRTIEAIYRELMSGSFALELPLRVGYLGPRGSFSHTASVRHFGSSVEHAALPTIEAVFKEVAGGHANYGLVPYENSTMGSITDTLDAFCDYDVSIYAEALIKINHNLLANCATGEIKEIHSKPQIFDQCRTWLMNHFPKATLVPATSSSAAVELAHQTTGVAAIGSGLAGELYGVNSLFQHIEDHPNNITRFLVIACQKAHPSSKDKTTIMFDTVHEPGALVDFLKVYRDQGINLSHIDKRPSREKNWTYTFFIDCDEHQDNSEMAQAIEESRQHCKMMKVLGSYPSANQIM